MTEERLAPWRQNRVELAGTVVSVRDRRSTPAGTPVASFLLRIEADPQDPAVVACEVPVVCLGTDAASPEIDVGRAVAVTGALTERRWKGPAGTTRRRFEVLARSVRPLQT